MLNFSLIKIRFYLLILLSCCCRLTLAQDPDPPTITHLSIDSLSQEVEIFWYNNSPQAIGYIIYFEDNAGLWIPLDTVLGAANLSYLTQNSNSQFQREKYSVVAFDNLGNSSSRSEAHSTLYLQYTYTVCDSICYLNWNLYPEMLNQQGFFIRVNSKDLINQQLTQIQDYVFDVQDSSFMFPVEYSKKYTFTLMAFNSLDSISRSNRFSVTTTQVVPPEYNYINRLTVNQNQKIELEITSNSSFVTHFEVFKTKSETGLKKYLGNAVLDQNTLTGKYIDNITWDLDNLSYYSVIPVDICNKNYPDLPSFPNSEVYFNVHQLKLKNIESNSEYMIVEWDNYPFFIEPTLYELWISVNGDQQLLNTVNSNSSQSIDISNYVGDICVFAKGIELIRNSINMKDTVFSRNVCVLKEPKVFFPSSFTPENGDQKNNFWKPIIHGGNVIESFELKIFNLWGAEVAELNSIDEYWDGKFLDKNVPIGKYSFNLEYSYSGGILVQKSGVINLFR